MPNNRSLMYLRSCQNLRIATGRHNFRKGAAAFHDLRLAARERFILIIHYFTHISKAHLEMAFLTPRKLVGYCLALPLLLFLAYSNYYIREEVLFSALIDSLFIAFDDFDLITPKL
jgi:hypothetical protein